jgi:hypothetical protein
MGKYQPVSSTITSSNTQNTTFNKSERCQAAAMRFIDTENQTNSVIESNNPSYISSHFWNSLTKSWYDPKTDSCYMTDLSSVENKKAYTTTVYNSLTGQELAWQTIGDDAVPPTGTFYVGNKQTTILGVIQYEKSLSMPGD